MMKINGVMGKQISYMTLIGVHSTMHLVHPNLMSCNYYLLCTICRPRVHHVHVVLHQHRRVRELTRAPEPISR